jgi:hypothetical protein
MRGATGTTPRPPFRPNAGHSTRRAGGVRRQSVQPGAHLFRPPGEGREKDHPTPPTQGRAVSAPRNGHLRRILPKHFSSAMVWAQISPGLERGRLLRWHDD